MSVLEGINITGIGTSAIAQDLKIKIKPIKDVKFEYSKESGVNLVKVNLNGKYIIINIPDKFKTEYNPHTIVPEIRNYIAETVFNDYPEEFLR